MKRVGKSEKWVTRPRGQKNKNFGTNSNDWCDSRVKKKTESRMLISQQPCGKVVMARVRRLRLAQGKARQTKSNKENRYVIKVMRFKTGNGIRFLRFARTKGCTKPFHWPLISYSIIILILSCTAGLKWNTGKLYYSTVELGYQQFMPFIHRHLYLYLPCLCSVCNAVTVHTHTTNDYPHLHRDSET